MHMLCRIFANTRQIIDIVSLEIKIPDRSNLPKKTEAKKFRVTVPFYAVYHYFYKIDEIFIWGSIQI